MLQTVLPTNDRHDVRAGGRAMKQGGWRDREGYASYPPAHEVMRRHRAGDTVNLQREKRFRGTPG